MKHQLRQWCPPIIFDNCFKRLKHGGAKPPKTFSDRYPCWKDAVSASSGYDSEEILEKVLSATLKVKRGEAVYERDSVLFDKIQYSWPVIASLMHTASQNRGALRVLDFGGALGSSYFETMEFTHHIKELKWGVVEQRNFVTSGQKWIADSRLQFFETIDDCHRAIGPNFALLSNALQYIPNYRQCIADLIRHNIPTIAIDRTIVNTTSEDKIFVQKVPPDIYCASYPVYSLSQPGLIETWTSHGYRLVAEFESLPFPALQEIDSTFKGYLFSKVTRE